MTALSVVVSGTIGNYTDLVSTVSSWLDRDDLSGVVPQFVSLCEARLNRELRTLMQENRLVFSEAGGGHVMPDDYRKMSRIWVTDSPSRTLTQVSALNAVEYETQSGIPLFFYEEGRKVYFVPAPMSSVNYECTYVARIPALTIANSTNWMLSEHPDCYLFGSLLEAAIYIRDEDAMDFLSPRLDSIIASIKSSHHLDKWSGGPIIPKAGPKFQIRGAYA